MGKSNTIAVIGGTGLTIDTPFDKKSFKTKMLSKIMKLSFPAVIADKQKEYSIISESNLDWTIVRLPLIEETETERTIQSSLTDCPGKKIDARKLLESATKVSKFVKPNSQT